jgi:hypothetical protein
MTHKYLYIDDENPENLKSIINGLNDQNIIQVELIDLTKFNSFELLKNHIIAQIPDGLILDLRLDGEGENRLNFPATSFAQDLRTITASNELKAFPLVLCSTSSKMKKTYELDKASHDLFDYKFEKSAAPNWKQLSIILKSLADYYLFLSEKKRNLSEIIGREDYKIFDSRIFENLLDENQELNAHDITQFILKELISHPGILIDENIVAARLGVDIHTSDKEWRKIKEEFLKKCKYSGIFGDAWQRWWFDKISDEFKKLAGGKKLQDFNAEQRVDILIKAGYDAKPAVPISPFCQSTEYWTVCEFYQKPLDPFEGFKIFEPIELKPWQEPKYISYSAALERRGIDQGLRPHPSEIDRLNDLKEQLSK